MYFPILINWTSPFQIFGLLGGIFHFLFKLLFANSGKISSISLWLITESALGSSHFRVNELLTSGLEALIPAYKLPDQNRKSSIIAKIHNVSE